MGEIRNLGRAYLRKYVVDGVSASTENEPQKPEGIAVFDLIDATVTSIQEETVAEVNAIVSDLSDRVDQIGQGEPNKKAAVRVFDTGSGTWATAFDDGSSLQSLTLATGDRIALDRTSASESGIFIVQASGAPVRATDMDADGEAPLASFLVTEGTHAGERWQITNEAVTLGTTDLTFIQIATGVATDLDALRAKGTTIPSASSIDLGAATGDFVDVSGTTTVAALGTVAAGVERVVRLTGNVTFTYNATSLITPGAVDYQGRTGDVLTFRSLGSGNWVMVAALDKERVRELISADLRASPWVSPDTLPLGSAGYDASSWTDSIRSAARHIHAAYITGGDANSVVTMTIANPGVISWTAHGLSAGTAVIFTTTGALPTGISAGTTYYVSATGLTTDAFSVAATVGGSRIETTGSQSGVHTARRADQYYVSIFSNQVVNPYDQIAVKRISDNTTVAATSAVAVTKSATGLTEVVVNGVSGYTDMQFRFLVDYTRLASGLLVNSASGTPLRIVRSTEAAYHETRILGLEQAPARIRSRAVNGNLDPTGTQPTWLSGATPVLQTPVAELLGYGIKQAAHFGTGAVVNYKEETLTSDDSGAPIVATALIYKDANGSWPSVLQLAAYAGASLVQASIGTSVYKQISPTCRRYWRYGTLPVNTGMTRLVYGFGTAISGAVAQVSGFGVYIAKRTIGIGDVQLDDWYGYLVSDPLIVSQLAAINSQLSDLTAGGASGPEREIRVAVVGDSRAWGVGYLGSATYVGEIETRLAALGGWKHATAITPVGAAPTILSSALWWGGSALKASGEDAGFQWTSTGDQVSVCIGRERDNDGAAIVALLVDGVEYGRFSTWNGEFFGESIVVGFTGDGTTKKFDLGRAFTYNHSALTVNAVAKTVGMNTQGYAGTVAASGKDAMIVRGLGVDGEGNEEVHHFLLFDVAPTNTHAISITFDAGESIAYMKSTIGQTTKGLDGTLESTYGDGTVVLDPEHPPAAGAIASGLDFRETDPRSIVTWRFPTSATRSLQLKIIELDDRASGTPCLYLNFVANRVHRIMNAGIGGKTASGFYAETGLRGPLAVAAFQPDIVYVDFAANDDWTSCVNTAWFPRTGLTDAEVRDDESSHYFETVDKQGTDDYDVDDIRMEITAITPTSVTLASGGTYNIAAGDVMTIGDFKGDSRRIAMRQVSGYNAGTRVVSWKRPLKASEIAYIDTLSDLITDGYATFLSSPTWRTAMANITDYQLAANPGTQIVYVTPGASNNHDRRLDYYRALCAGLATEKGAMVADVYGRTREHTYSTPPTGQLYLDASQGTTSDGSTEYDLYYSSGSAPNPASVTGDWWLRVTSVTVDGIERLNDECYIRGGRKYGWASADPMTESNDAATADPYRLVFSDNEPGIGEEIVVKYLATPWSIDYCHTTDSATGIALYGQALADPLTAALAEAVGNLGRFQV